MTVDKIKNGHQQIPVPKDIAHFITDAEGAPIHRGCAGCGQPHQLRWVPEGSTIGDWPCIYYCPRENRWYDSRERMRTEITEAEEAA